MKFCFVCFAATVWMAAKLNAKVAERGRKTLAAASSVRYDEIDDEIEIVVSSLTYEQIDSNSSGKSRKLCLKSENLWKLLKC